MCGPEFFASDPAQLPDRLMEPAMQPGQPPSPIVITRDEILSVWREQHPDACWCAPGKADKRCPQHGWPTAPEIISPDALDKLLPATVPLTYRGQHIGMARVTRTKDGLEISTTLRLGADGSISTDG